MGSNSCQLWNKIMLCKLARSTHLISKPNFPVAVEVLQDLSVRPVRHLRYWISVVMYGTISLQTICVCDTILKAGKEVPWISQSAFSSSCYAYRSSVIPYIFPRPIHRNVGNDSDVTSTWGWMVWDREGWEGVQETKRTKLQVLPPSVGVLFVASVHQ